MATVASLADLDGTPHASAFPTAEPKTIRLTLGAGERVEPHRHPGRAVVLFVCEGELDLHLDAECHNLQAGDLARFDGSREISPVAVEDTTALVVLAPGTDA